MKKMMIILAFVVFGISSNCQELNKISCKFAGKNGGDVLISEVLKLPKLTIDSVGFSIVSFECAMTYNGFSKNYNIYSDTLSNELMTFLKNHQDSIAIKGSKLYITRVIIKSPNNNQIELKNGLIFKING